MNASVYLFSELNDTYIQYPDDHTVSIFKKFLVNAKSTTQIAIHRDGNLMYYSYIWKPQQTKYIGLCVVLNGLFIKDISALFSWFENTIKSVVNFYEQNNSVISVTKTYQNEEDIERFVESLRKEFNRLEPYAESLPAISFGTLKDSSKNFSVNNNQEEIVKSSYTNGYTYIKKWEKNDAYKPKQPQSNMSEQWITTGIIIGIVVIIFTIANNINRSNSSYSYDSVIVEDKDYYGNEDTYKNDHANKDTYEDDYADEDTYEEKANKFINRLNNSQLTEEVPIVATVVAKLIDKQRHCIYVLSSNKDGETLKFLHCFNLETNDVNTIHVPYQIEENNEQIADAKLIGDNLYVINTSYRLGNSVACLNTLTGKWSCFIPACADCNFVGNNQLKVTYSELVYEGECLADNVYDYETKFITLK
ncbi:MAG: hypothetical protein K2H04_03560 [Bacteroidaceae bacterium]|nr:hypothetical protein [Bacteroidaceae bacterium]